MSDKCDPDCPGCKLDAVLAQFSEMAIDPGQVLALFLERLAYHYGEDCEIHMEPLGPTEDRVVH